MKDKTFFRLLFFCLIFYFLFASVVGLRDIPRILTLEQTAPGQLSISGENFHHTLEVHIDGIAAERVRRSSDGCLSVTIPNDALRAGELPVRVINRAPSFVNTPSNTLNISLEFGDIITIHPPASRAARSLMLTEYLRSVIGEDTIVLIVGRDEGSTNFTRHVHDQFISLGLADKPLGRGWVHLFCYF